MSALLKRDEYTSHSFSAVDINSDVSSDEELSQLSSTPINKLPLWMIENVQTKWNKEEENAIDETFLSPPWVDNFLEKVIFEKQEQKKEIVCKSKSLPPCMKYSRRKWTSTHPHPDSMGNNNSENRIVCEDNANNLLPPWMQEAKRGTGSYSQRYDICSSPVLTEICSPRLRAQTFSSPHVKESLSLTSSITSSVNASPAVRRRRISVKSSHVRKQSTRIAPRQRWMTLSSATSHSRSPRATRKEHVSSPVISTRREHAESCLASTVIPSRRLSVAVGRKTSNAFKRPVRRCSEPFLLDPVTLQNKWNRKQSTSTRPYGRRRLSTTATLPTSSKQKLHALAKDELLASLTVPLSRSRTDLTSETDEQVQKDDSISVEEENNKQSEKDRREMKRLRVIDEILETEKNYISCLETLNAVFRNQLEGSNIITEKDLNSLFPSQLNEIKTSHTWFMKELEERMNNENWRGIIGDIFAKMTSETANLLEIYTGYVNSFPKSISALSKCTRSSQKFRKFLEECYENPVVERLDLPSFLLSPVQRLPRYILLLRELLKYTDEDHPDRYFISEAMREMSGLISSLNSSIHSSMEFYSASDSRRKKMSRQLTTKKRNKRTSSTVARQSKKLGSINESKPSTDADQGYCSFSERKDESPEDETPQRKVRSSTWRSKRSVSMTSSSSGDVIIRRKNEGLTGRNSITRKSWRRSIGAVFSQFWSSREEYNNNVIKEDTKSMTNSVITELSSSEAIYEEKTTDQTDSVVNSRKNSAISLSKRKIAIIHSPPPDESLTEISFEQEIDKTNSFTEDPWLVESPLTAGTPTLIGSPISAGAPSITSSLTSEEDQERRNSVESNKSSSSSLRTPSSPQNFRKGKLRGSAGPAFKSIFQRSNMKKTLSWGDELNIMRDGQVDKKRHKRYSISLRKSRHNNSKDQINKNLHEPYSPHVRPMSMSSKSLNRDNLSLSSTDTISSRTSVQSNVREEETEGGECLGNQETGKHSKEKKRKFMKHLRNFVSKK